MGIGVAVTAVFAGVFLRNFVTNANTAVAFKLIVWEHESVP